AGGEHRDDPSCDAAQPPLSVLLRVDSGPRLLPDRAQTGSPRCLRQALAGKSKLSAGPRAPRGAVRRAWTREGSARGVGEGRPSRPGRLDGESSRVASVQAASRPRPAVHRSAPRRAAIAPGRTHAGTTLEDRNAGVGGWRVRHAARETFWLHADGQELTDSRRCDRGGDHLTGARVRSEAEGEGRGG